jgi:hypothetical protein
VLGAVSVLQRISTILAIRLSMNESGSESESSSTFGGGAKRVSSRNSSRGE